MKLYATVSSERATKGQGGNEYLDIDVFVGEAKNPYKLACFTVRRSDELEDENGTTDASGYAIYDNNDDLLWYITDRVLTKEQQKGEKQKGD